MVQVGTLKFNAMWYLRVTRIRAGIQFLPGSMFSITTAHHPTSQGPKVHACWGRNSVGIALA